MYSAASGSQNCSRSLTVLVLIIFTITPGVGIIIYLCLEMMKQAHMGLVRSHSW